MNYETSTDFELNKRLAELQGYEVQGKSEFQLAAEKHGEMNASSIITCRNSKHGCFTQNYCDDWSDIMPIAVELGVCLSPVDPKSHHEAMVFDKNGYIKMSIYDKSPQRALVICCIKVLEVAK